MAPEPTAAPGTTAAAPGTTAEGSGAPPTDHAAMTITIDITPEALWEDGAPITWEDFECTWQANVNTPGSIYTAGYDKITSVDAGSSDRQVVISFNEMYAPYKTLFAFLIKKAAVADCNDISREFQTELPISARPYRIDRWSRSQLTLVPNEHYWGEPPRVDEVVMVPFADQETEIASLLSGDVDFIFPQFTDTLAASVEGQATIEPGIVFGSDFESLNFQQAEGPFADPVFREAFSLSIDREAVFQQIFQPIFSAAGVEGELLQCGPIVPGPYCFDSFADTVYDPEAAAALLEGDGWTRNAQGLWEKDGRVPRIRWMINTGNLRRENTQAFLIPLLRENGFNVVPDNGTAEEVFQQRLPAFDYDVSMTILSAAPDPGYLTTFLTCAQVPSEENSFQGRNLTGWCNEEASAALEQADVTVDETERAEFIHSALDAMAEDHAMLPLVQYPVSGLWRSDRLAGPVAEDLNNYQAFQNIHEWEDVDGDGQIVIGAEQWPGCLNPVTECANSFWYALTTAFKVLPAVWDTTSELEFVPSDLVVGEPVVEVAD